MRIHLVAVHFQKIKMIEITKLVAEVLERMNFYLIMKNLNICQMKNRSSMRLVFWKRTK